MIWGIIICFGIIITLVYDRVPGQRWSKTTSIISRSFFGERKNTSEKLWREIANRVIRSYIWKKNLIKLRLLTSKGLLYDKFFLCVNGSNQAGQERALKPETFVRHAFSQEKKSF